jgi:UDP-N-acetylmuramoylalanine--D-glutamate ligase
MLVMDYTNKTIAVIGMARTGLAVAEVMRELGARVVLYDRKSESELADAIAVAHALGVEVRPGTDNVCLDGVDLIVPSPGVPANLPVFAEARKRGIEVISEIELAYRLAKAPIVAITGTNGKTTTTVLTGRMFEADGRDTYIAGNVVAGDIRMPLVMAAHKASSGSVIVAEISTFQLEWIAGFRPKVAMLLNVTSDHLDRHDSVEQYASLKARIFANQTAGDFAVINAENAFTASLADKLAGRVLEFATKSQVDQGGFVRGDDLIVRFDGREIAICKRSDIPLRGIHNVENVLAAACAAIALGVKPESIAKAVREMKPVEHRLEPVAVIDGVEYVNNSMCTNVDAVVRSVEAIDEPQIVIAGGKAKGEAEDYTPVGEAFRRKAKHVVLIGADAGVIRRAAEKAGFSALSDAGSMSEAVEIARTLAQPGDVVVLTPGLASFDMFDNFEHRGQVFKQIVRKMERGEI